MRPRRRVLSHDQTLREFGPVRPPGRPHTEPTDSLDVTQLELMHQRLAVAVDETVTCPHDGTDGCTCRKPLPGMLRDLAERWGIALDASFMVGDRWVDIAAGAAAGTVTLLVDRPHSWKATSSGGPEPRLRPDHRVASVAEAAQLIARVVAERSS